MNAIIAVVASETSKVEYECYRSIMILVVELLCRNRIGTKEVDREHSVVIFSVHGSRT